LTIKHLDDTIKLYQMQNVSSVLLLWKPASGFVTRPLVVNIKRNQ